MNESLKTPAKWAKISRRFPGRTQHQIKNRFIGLINRELRIKRERIRELIRQKNNKDSLKESISQTLKVLNVKTDNFLKRTKKENQEKNGNRNIKIEEIEKVPSNPIQNQLKLENQELQIPIPLTNNQTVIKNENQENSDPNLMDQFKNAFFSRLYFDYLLFVDFFTRNLNQGKPSTDP